VSPGKPLLALEPKYARAKREVPLIKNRIASRQRLLKSGGDAKVK
jgi:hypothetical protein